MNPAQAPHFVQWFRQAAPYVHAFRGRTFVIGFPGELAAEGGVAGFLHDLNLLAALGIRLVVVHGARPQIEAELKEKHLRSRYARGLRITDAAALVAVKHAAGVLRLELEAQLSQGLPNSPMAGAQIRVASGNFITAQPVGVVDGIDFQFTGSVRKVDTVAISRRLDAGDVVLISHLGFSPTGEIFNLAWEDIAESTAIALKADKLLLYADELPATRKGRVLHEVTARELATLATKEKFSAEQKRVVKSTLNALAGGVGRVHVVSRKADGATLLELFTRAGVGTMVTADGLERLRTARIEDVGGLIALIRPLEQEGALVRRSRERLEAEIGNFQLIAHDGAIVGCAALYPFDKQSAEFACLAVAPEYRDAGYGERLLHACEEIARTKRIKRLFALTTRAAHWFLHQGFKPADVSALPEEKRALYNWKRGSKVFVKTLR
jgi:amino-acid N-acetyltransferase